MLATIQQVDMVAIDCVLEIFRVGRSCQNNHGMKPTHVNFFGFDELLS